MISRGAASRLYIRQQRSYGYEIINIINIIQFFITPKNYTYTVQKDTHLQYSDTILTFYIKVANTKR